MQYKSFTQYEFDEVRNIEKLGGKLGLPMAPGQWVSGSLEHIDVYEIKIAHAHGIGGKSYEYYIELTEDVKKKIFNDKMVEIEIFDTKEKVIINTKYIVDVRERTIAKAKMDSKNGNFPLGIYTYYYKLRKGERITELIDRF